MRAIKCEQCGSTEFMEIPNYRVCKYCHTHYPLITPETVKTAGLFASMKAASKKPSEIDINADVKRLLMKCKAEPSKAKKYAKLILDIDPTNQAARRYL